MRSSPSAPPSPDTRQARSLWDASSPAWFQAFRELPREHGFEPLHVEGTLPEDLRGTLYRVGPAVFSAFGQRYGHWFDGEGAVSAVRVAEGQAWGAARLIETQHREQERRAGRMLYLRYGTVTPVSPLQRIRGRTLNAANTALLHWQGRLFALYEQGLPTELHSDELITLGETNLRGAVRRTFSAHPRRVPERRATYNFGTRFSPGGMKLDLYELPDVGRARCLGTLSLPVTTLLHDFIATPRYLVFLVPPLKFHLMRMVFGQGPVGLNLEFDASQGTEVIVVPIDEPDRPVRFTVDPFFLWHFANGFEERGELVLDIVRYEDFDINLLLGEFVTGDLKHPPTGRLSRLRLDLVRRRMSSAPLWEAPCEYPNMSSTVAARDRRYVYLLASSTDGPLSPPELLAKVDHRTGRAETVSPGPGQYPSEPLFAPRPGATEEDDGYLLSLVYDSRHHASHLAVFDARRLAQGPLARAWFDHHIPFTVHGVWVPTTAV
jgi:all-trans-8'-apo-beta-carotenal 15,15'-oxygenase